MNDPHVERLMYQIGSNLVAYRDTSAVTGGESRFQVSLENEQATVEMLDHFATIDDARAAVEPYLRAWEVHATITFHDTAEPLLLTFKNGQVVDRRPDPDEGPTVRLTASSSAEVTAIVAIGAERYPAPPPGFTVSPDVETMWVRWRAYRADRESLPSMAYFCLTVVEASMGLPRQGQRSRAATTYGLRPEVLKKLGDLVSEVGDVHERRKQHAANPRRYTSDENEWMKAVVKKMILRVGEWAHDPTQSVVVLTMNDFPRI